MTDDSPPVSNREPTNRGIWVTWTPELLFQKRSQDFRRLAGSVEGTRLRSLSGDRFHSPFVNDQQVLVQLAKKFL